MTPLPECELLPLDPLEDPEFDPPLIPLEDPEPLPLDPLEDSEPALLVPELTPLDPELADPLEELPALLVSVACVVLFPNPLPALAREFAEGVNPARSENALSGLVNP